MSRPEEEGVLGYRSIVRLHFLRVCTLNFVGDGAGLSGEATLMPMSLLLRCI